MVASTARRGRTDTRYRVRIRVKRGAEGYVSKTAMACSHMAACKSSNQFQG